MDAKPVYYPGCRIRLTCNLQKYNPKLVAGVEGTILKSESRLGDRFCQVSFDNIGILDCLYDGLDPIRPTEYNERAKAYEDRSMAELKTASNVVLYTGPRGGFKYLSYTMMSNGISNSISNGDKSSAESIIIKLKSLGIPVTTSIV